MVGFYKEKNMKFRLKDMESKSDFSIWKGWDKRNDEFKDKDGNLMNFPIRDGILTNEKGDIKQVADIKFMPNKDFREQYPRYGRTFQFVRQIYVDGVEYSYAFKQTSNNKLNEKMEDMKKMGKDPIKSEFEQVFDTSKSPSDKYSIKISATDLPPVEVKEGSGETGSAPPDKASEVLEAIKNFGGSMDESRFIEIMKSNSIDETKAKELYVEYKK